jgi:hypothetical protein
MQVQQKTTTMKPDRRYLDLLQRAGLSVDYMAEYLSSKGIGTPQQWRYTLSTGDAGRFSKQEREVAAALIQNNPQLMESIKGMLAA